MKHEHDIHFLHWVGMPAALIGYGVMQAWATSLHQLQNYSFDYGVANMTLQLLAHPLLFSLLSLLCGKRGVALSQSSEKLQHTLSPPSRMTAQLMI